MRSINTPELVAEYNSGATLLDCNLTHEAVMDTSVHPGLLEIEVDTDTGTYNPLSVSWASATELAVVLFPYTPAPAWVQVRYLGGSADYHTLSGIDVPAYTTEQVTPVIT